VLAAADPGVSGFALDLSNEVPGLQRCLEACTANNAFAGDADFPPRKTKEFGVVGVEAKDPAAGEIVLEAVHAVVLEKPRRRCVDLKTSCRSFGVEHDRRDRFAAFFFPFFSLLPPRKEDGEGICSTAAAAP